MHVIDVLRKCEEDDGFHALIMMASDRDKRQSCTSVLAFIAHSNVILDHSIIAPKHAHFRVLHKRCNVRRMICTTASIRRELRTMQAYESLSAGSTQAQRS